MSKEARELNKAITDLATRMSDEWCATPDETTDSQVYERIYDKAAVILIDAAFAKVREECAERACMAVASAPTSTPRKEYLVSLIRAAILGTEAK